MHPNSKYAQKYMAEFNKREERRGRFEIHGGIQKGSRKFEIQGGIQKGSAPSGNRTRGSTMATLNFTTKPMVLAVVY